MCQVLPYLRGAMLKMISNNLDLVADQKKKNLDQVILPRAIIQYLKSNAP